MIEKLYNMLDTTSYSEDVNWFPMWLTTRLEMARADLRVEITSRHDGRAKSGAARRSRSRTAQNSLSSNKVAQ